MCDSLLINFIVIQLKKIDYLIITDASKGRQQIFVRCHLKKNTCNVMSLTVVRHVDIKMYL